MIARPAKTYQAQVWRLSYPDGKARRIVNDSNSYRSLSLTADSRTLVAMQSISRATLSIAPDGDASRAHQISAGLDQACWTPDNKIVYTSGASGNPDIWMIEPDGTGQKQLTASPGVDWGFAVSPDGRHIVFESDRSGESHIWKMDIDGANPVQLTRGSGEKFPDYSPDGKWIVYVSVRADKDSWTLWKAPLHGGEPAQLTDLVSSWPAVSPDGKLIAFFYQQKQPQPRLRIVIIPFEGGSPVRAFDAQQTVAPPFYVQWSADGQALNYLDIRDGVSNIWSQPLDGRPPRQVTNFTLGRIRNFDWSRDGQLVLVQGGWSNDAVMISNFISNF